MKYTDLLSQVTEKLGGSFLLCNILSQRIKQLEKGAEPRIYLNGSDSTSMEIALREILEDKLTFLPFSNKGVAIKAGH